MLTLHSTRRLLSGTRLWVGICFLLVTIILIGAGVLDLCFIGNQYVLQCIGAALLVVIAGSQLVLIWCVLRNPHPTHQFYERLSRLREDRPDFVESYRHMREHGNAVSIVVFELLLAFIFWSLRPVGTVSGNAVSLGRISVIMAIWITPSALVWLLGSSLERYLSRSRL
jgi:hypothetical protein